jgi:hypothetical protein
MPLKPAFGKPGEPTIVGDVAGATQDLDNKMMLDNYGKGMQNPNLVDDSNLIDDVELNRLLTQEEADAIIKSKQGNPDPNSFRNSSVTGLSDNINAAVSQNSERIAREEAQVQAVQNAVNQQESRENFEQANQIASSDPFVSGKRLAEMRDQAANMSPRGQSMSDEEYNELLKFDESGVSKLPISKPGLLSMSPQQEMRIPRKAVTNTIAPAAPPFNNSMLDANGMQYGGGVDNESLMNAVNLINRAFGGQAYNIPQAFNGMDLQGRLSMEEAMAKQGMNPGQIDVLEDSQFNIDQGALGQTFMKGANIANFGFNYLDDYANTQKAREIRQDPLSQNIASYQGMDSGIHNQQGQDYANNVNAQSLNVTSNYGAELGGMPRQMMEYGGQMYEIGGSVNITEEEKRKFEAAGFTLT